MATKSKGPPAPKPAEGERVSVTFRILEGHRDRLKALAEAMEKEQQLIVEEALEAYWQSLTEEQRAGIEKMQEIKKLFPKKGGTEPKNTH